MIVLLISIIASSIIFVIFKLFQQFKVDTFQAIVFNYFTAFLCGIILFHHEWNEKVLEESQWIIGVLSCSVLFISLFILIGLSSQRNGVASTSVAVKMSMALSVLAMILFYNESVRILKIAGILMAFMGVILVTYEKKNKTQNNDAALWMLVILFFGSSLLDLILNYSQKSLLGSLSPSLFSAFGFGLAGIIGFIILLFQIQQRKTQIVLRNVFAGIILGIPNFFSIYLLLMAYQTSGLSDSNVVTIVNIGIVGLSALLGWSLFKENMQAKKVVGLILSVIAIALISFNS